MSIQTPISPCLWFDTELEEAAEFYTKVFPNSSIGAMSRYPAEDGEEPRVMAGEFTLDGLLFRAINGGPQFAGFTETISFAITCADQGEVDHYWSELTRDGGEESVCGWLKDRFGLSWQVVPQRLYELVTDPDPQRARAATEAMMQMRKIVVADLEEAADAAGPAGRTGAGSR